MNSIRNERAVLARWSIALLVPVFALQSRAETYVSVEGAATWQARNDQRIPGTSGTDFSFVDFNRGPLPTYRVYVGHVWNERHEIRALYAPLDFTLNGRFDKSVRFMNTTLAPGVDTEGRYKFNSYRLTYAYHFSDLGGWKLALGFTGKIRDAEVRLSQGATRETKANVGFVPLLNFQAARELGAGWTFRFDLDGLAAPQGRAFDGALFVERDLQWLGSSVLGGLRSVEGGADNDEVYNFAWIHFATLGLRAAF